MFTLRLIFYGLVAFVLNDPVDPSKLQVLLVDVPSIQSSSDGCQIPPHTAAIFVAAADCSDQGKPCLISPELPEFMKRPDNSLVKGGWPLRGRKVQLDSLAGQPLKPVLDKRRPKAKLPESAEEAIDFSWVPNPKTGRLLAGRCKSGAGDCPLGARIILTEGRIATCHLTELEENHDDGATPKVCAFKFKPLAKKFSQSVLTQAVADAVMTTIKFPYGTEVKLTIATLEGNDPNPRQIVLRDGGMPYIDVWVLNVPEKKPKAEVEDPCHGPGVDKHFELYYGLSEQGKKLPIAFAKRPIPKAKATCVSSMVQPKGADMCPLLRFKLKYAGSGPIPGDKPACAIRQLEEQ